MQQLINDAIKNGIAYLKATNNSPEAWAVIVKNALLCGEKEGQKIINGITAGIN